MVTLHFRVAKNDSGTQLVVMKEREQCVVPFVFVHLIEELLNDIVLVFEIDFDHRWFFLQLAADRLDCVGISR